MERNKNHWSDKKYFILFCMVILMVSSFAFIQCKQEAAIQGTWIAQKDKKSKWVFTKDSTTKWFYNNKLVYTFTYNISKASPQCGKDVKTGPSLVYLSLTNTQNENQRCYYINGLTDSTLSLSPFGRSNKLLFSKK